MGRTIIDVRTPQEFLAGHVKGSVNIPLQELESRLDEVKQMQGEIVLCCASGARSARAYGFLRQQGLNTVSNGGSWVDID
ncbi:MAG: rhodanese-like domain-containing protein [Bacteroidetes bacterium]|nr:rhodanese-like domain-containing protein [Bacteroidota bacterium]MBS1972759.1 rhodanese-like domain-containing protein [Bacteroidota bacterium]